MSEVQLKSELSLFDVTNLVVGAIIGADVYVASAFGAKLLGPFSLVVWVVAGIIAIVIALCFAQCAALLPKVGGPYAYAHAAWGGFAGFVVGWSLWLAEWLSLAVFPVAFTNYLKTLGVIKYV
jgi:amino acid transporter